MSSLIRFELRKLFGARALYICAGILVLLIVIFAATNKLTDVAMEEFSSSFDYDEYVMPDDEDDSLYNSGYFSVFADDPDMGVYVEEDGTYGYSDLSDDITGSMGSSIGLLSENTGSSWLLSSLSNIYVIVVFAAFISVFVCGDFGNGTIKNILTKGYSRSEVYFAKYIVCLLVSFGYAVIAFIAGFLCGTIMWNIGHDWSAKFLPIMLAQLVVVAAYNALFNFIAAWTKRVGPALALSIALPIAIPLILAVVDLIAYEADINSANYWLSGALMRISSSYTDGKDILLSLACAVAYGVVFTIAGWLIARKREV